MGPTGGGRPVGRERPAAAAATIARSYARGEQEVTVRTSLGDHLLALRRPAALAALAATAGGAVAAMAPSMALWRLTAQVRALDTTGEQPVTVLRGAETSSVVWVIAAAGVAAVVVSLLVAVDRPPPLAESVLVAAGAAVIAAVGLLVIDRPGTHAFGHHAGARELVAGDVPLPTGVGIELAVEPALGLWVLGAAGLLVIAGSMVALRRG